ncbi:MAG: hypothetical protein JWL62_3333, partial [Hyphomicrobiales bacterium]|nr:hypothetical protein [Hyphomicrobiales bacterium]
DGLEAAREEAIAGAREIMSNRILTGARSAHWRFEIVDDAGSVVLDFPFTDAMD